MDYVYVLRSEADGKLYVGLTVDLERRIKEHNAGKVGATRARRPLVLVHVETFNNRREAARREKYLKSGSGRKFLSSKI